MPLTPSAPRHSVVPTPLGSYTIAAEGDRITGIWREGQAHFPTPERLGTEMRPHENATEPSDRFLARAATQLHAYMTGERETFDLPLAPRGTPFQLSVWERLRSIPRGATTTYGAIARDLEAPRGAQAVGRAVGSNPISIAIPCHRVVSSTGALTGYAGGIETKRALLALEGVTLG